MELITWFMLVGWAMVSLINNWEPIMFLGCCIGLGLTCIANAIHHIFDRHYDQKLLKYYNDRKENQ